MGNQKALCTIKNVPRMAKRHKEGKETKNGHSLPRSGIGTARQKGCKADSANGPNLLYCNIITTQKTTCNRIWTHRFVFKAANFPIKSGACFTANIIRCASG